MFAIVDGCYIFYTCAPDPEAEGITAAAVIEDHTNNIMADGVPNNDEELGTGITSAAPDENCVIDTTLMDHLCTQNYDGSSGAMESDGILLLMKQLQKRYNGNIWLEYVITDDDTKMKKYFNHPAYRPRGKKNIGGSLPADIPEPRWYADPTHRAKCVTGSFLIYAMVRSPLLEQLNLMHSE